MSTTDTDDFIRAGTLEELKAKGCIVVSADRPVAVFYHEDKVHAVDNRCPHLGFPLHKGTVKDGILTCHWHHARFDLCSGCTFDLFADDVPGFDVEVRADEVYVAALPRQAMSKPYYLRRLREGMEQNISLIQAKCILGLLKTGTEHSEIIREVALFGARRSGNWNGLTLLTAVGNILADLEPDTAYLALYQATRQVAADCAGQATRRELHPLENTELSLETLKRWLRYWIEVRHSDGAERTLLTAIQSGASPAELSDLIFSAATDRFYAAGGHVLDACNKAFELLDLIGWENAAIVFPTIVPNLAQGTGGEEMNSWRHPIDLVPPLREIEASLPRLFEEGREKQWDDVPALSHALLGEDPLEIINTLRQSILAGAHAEQLSKALCYAAAMRLARFGSANEVADWFNPVHTFTYCNAVHQAIRRRPSPEVVRGVFHGAMSIYLDRFLNVPPARLPGERGATERAPENTPELLQKFLDHLDQRHELEAASRDVFHYLQTEQTVEPLFNTLTQATAREDLDFHSYQVLEAGIRQYQEWIDTPQSQHIPLAMARYLAAHCPTQRARQHTSQIALRLHRGESLYEEDQEE